ncbi:MAG: PVC-type heme-binding CxxCH protein [Verrucomicrobiota bacterium]
MRALFFFLPVILTAAGTALLHAAEPPPAPGKDVKPLFDGSTLNGWEGDAKMWRVENGLITGGSLTEEVKHNDFLATKAEYGNFIVRLQIKLTGSGGFINSGFQIRSQRVPNDSEMAGYQCDYGEPAWYGCVYDESRRNKLMAQSDMKVLGPALKRNDWNDYVIRADGPRITTWINGVMGVDYFEADPKIVQDGHMGIQVHGGGKALVQVRNISIEELPASPKRVGAADPVKPAKESPLSPEEEKAAFSLAPGLEMELVVSEDMDKAFGKFVAVQFDQRGRLWTMTALEYPVDANENPGAADALYASKAKDRVLVYDITDRGTDGKSPQFAKEPTVFADGLAIPLGILPYKDGCYVQHGHDLALLRDTNGDGKSDQRDVILTGFGVQDSHLFPHQFTRAPGGWLWLGQGAFNYGKVMGPENKQIQFDQTRMAKFRPDGSRFTITSNGPCNIWGLAMNGEGESFIQEANDFGYPVMPFHEYGNYPGCSNGQWKSYAPEFPASAPDFRMGGTGLSGLALTDASGPFPPEWSDVMLVANPITNRIQAIKMHRDSSRPDGWRLELLQDVVASGDPWFRPVGMTLGPDGAVYIVDWYNKIISHNEVPRNHPERDKKRGRIWRLKGKSQPAFAVPDFTKLPDLELVAKFGGKSLTQAHMAWQEWEDGISLNDRDEAATEALGQLLAQGRPAEKGGSGPENPYPAAARIQALWALEGQRKIPWEQLAADSNPVIRREAVKALGRRWVSGQGWDLSAPKDPVTGNPGRGALVLFKPLMKDSDPSVRREAFISMGSLLNPPVLYGSAATVLPNMMEVILAFLQADLSPIDQPVTASTQSGKPIKTGAAYQREYERYLVRMFLEYQPGAVAAFLDSDWAKSLPPENLMVASLSLPAKDSAPRVARLLAQLGRAPNDEEILRLAEAPEASEVKSALSALVATPAGLDALLRLKAKFDARTLAPLVTDTARALLGAQPDVALKVISAFKLTALEPDLAAMAAKAATPAMLLTLRDLGSTQSAVFLPLAKSADPKLRDAALAALASTPGQLLPLWPVLNSAQRTRALDALTSTPAGSQALVSAATTGAVPKDELDGPLVEKLQAVLGPDHPPLKALIGSMADLFSQVLVLNGKPAAWVESDLTLEGPFTVETWIRLDPGIGNEDSLLAAPGVVDLNFYDGRLRVWAAGLNDVIVSKKALSPGAWMHVAVTRDAQGKFTIYQNGEPDQTEGGVDPRPYPHLAIGHSNTGKGTGAELTEFRVWNTCRTASEIRTWFDRTGLTEPMAYYRPLNAAWDKLHEPARVSKTMDFPTLATPEMAKALDEKFDHYRALANKPGDPAKGQAVAALCTACHTVNGQGGMIGPNLSSVGAMGTEAILRNILTPNAAMEPGYRVFRAELTDGTIKEGFLASRDENAIVIRLPGTEDQRIPADQIRKSGFTKRSLMPEGLELSMTPGQWTDLFAWLRERK